MADGKGLRRFLAMAAFAFSCLLVPVAARAGIFDIFESGHARQTGPHELAVAPDPDGIYYIYGNVNGAQIRFVVDTGSDDVVLTRKDARRAGIDLSRLDFSQQYDAETGTGYQADTTLNHLAVGPIALNHVSASINDEGGASLLGMTFLHRLKSVEIRDNKLYLRW